MFINNSSITLLYFLTRLRVGLAYMNRTCFILESSKIEVEVHSVEVSSMARTEESPIPVQVMLLSVWSSEGVFITQTQTVDIITTLH